MYLDLSAGGIRQENAHGFCCGETATNETHLRLSQWCRTLINVDVEDGQ